MPGTLYVVATPIGNLEDVTLRALRVLREVSLIAAEDTRRTARLLQHYSISTRTTSLHAHNERSKSGALIARLVSGDSIALVSDAGTPVIADPGTHLVAQAHAAGIRVEPIPGANAALSLLSASGFPGDQFVFAGFPPNRSNARQTWLAGLADETRVLVFYEAPHRIRLTLGDMLQAFGDRRAALGRELTKAHEELVVKPISQLIGAGILELGEFTIAVEGKRPIAPVGTGATAQQLANEFGDMTNNNGLARREAIRQLAIRHGLSARTVYQKLEESKRFVE